MSSDDTHAIIESIRLYATNADEASIDGIATNFAVLNDGARVDVLQKLRGHLTGETPTRRTAELMSLTRKMSGVHERLRRVGR